MPGTTPPEPTRQGRRRLVTDGRRLLSGAPAGGKGAAPPWAEAHPGLFVHTHPAVVSQNCVTGWQAGVHSVPFLQVFHEYWQAVA